MKQLFYLLTFSYFILSQNQMTPKERYNLGQSYYNKALKAYKNANVDSAIYYFKNVLNYRKMYHHALKNIAFLYLKTKQADSAYHYLTLLNSRSYYNRFPDDMYSVLSDKQRNKVLKDSDGIKKRITNSELTYELDEPLDINESVVYFKKSNALFISSVYNKNILKVDLDTRKKKVFFSYKTGIFSLKLHAGKLWASYSYIDNIKNAAEKSSGVLILDPENAKIIDNFVVNDGKEHIFGDFIINNHSLYLSDSKQNLVYSINTNSKELKPLFQENYLMSAQGICLVSEKLYIADYTEGIFLLNTINGKLSELLAPREIDLRGIDGLYNYKNYLIAIQNGIKPNRISAFKIEKNKVISQKILAQDPGIIEDPTLGFIYDDNFYAIANSGWPYLNKSGKLENKQAKATKVIRIDLKCLE